MRTTTGRGSYSAALRVAEFRVLAASSLMSILGSSAAYLAVTVLVYRRTGSALLSALTFVASFVPYLLGGTLLSGLVDRVAPRRLMACCDLAAAGLVAAIAAPRVPLPAVYGALFAIGTLAPVRSGAANGIVADILAGPAFVPGRSVLRIISQGAQIGGVAAGGLLLGPFGPRGALVADAAGLAVSATLVASGLTRRPAAHRSTGAGLVADSLRGLGEIWRYPAVRRLLLLGWLVPFAAVAPEALAAPAVSQLGRPAQLIGVWMAAIPAGIIAGDLMAVWALPAALRQRLTWPLALAVPASLVPFAARPPFPAAVGILAVGAMCASYGLGLDQLLRDRTPDRLRARMYALQSTGLMVTQGLGFAAAGALGQLLPAADAIAVAGGAGVVAVLLLPPRARPHGPELSRVGIDAQAGTVSPPA